VHRHCCGLFHKVPLLRRQLRIKEQSCHATIHGCGGSCWLEFRLGLGGGFRRFFFCSSDSTRLRSVMFSYVPETDNLSFTIVEWNLVSVYQVCSPSARVGFPNMIFRCIRVHDSTVTLSKEVCLLFFHGKSLSVLPAIISLHPSPTAASAVTLRSASSDSLRGDVTHNFETPIILPAASLTVEMLRRHRFACGFSHTHGFVMLYTFSRLIFR